MGVHRLGHMGEAGQGPQYTPLVTHLPTDLLRALDEHITNRVYTDGLPEGSSMEMLRDAQLALGLRYLIDHWPDIGPYATPSGGAGERNRPPASEGASA